MYEVSQKYITAMNKPVIRSKLCLVLDEEELTEADILAGSFSLSNQCTATSDITLGAVYIGELSVTFMRSVTVPRNSWKGRQITASYKLLVDTDEWEEVPLGVYTIAEANYSKTGTEVKAYDNMSLLDKNYSTDATSGTPYALLSTVASACHVTLGNTEQEIRALPNGTETLSLYTPNDCKTWRDLTSCVAQAVGCFAFADRLGNITLKRLYSPSQATIDPSHRFVDAKVSDFITYYSGVSLVNLRTESTEYYGDLYDDTGATINLGTNPLLQYGTKNHREEMARRILAEVENYRYVPCSAALPSAYVCLDLGDVIALTDGLAGQSSAACVMRYDFNKQDGFEFRTYGDDPDLANARSKVDKDISGLLANAEQDKYVVYAFRNSEDITIHDGQTLRVINLRIASINDTSVVFQGEIVCDESIDRGKCKVHYKLNNSEIDYHPQETWLEGKHILSLLYKMDIDYSQQYQWEVYLEAIDGDITIRTGEASGIISGIGLVASNKWTGYLDFQEHVNDFAVNVLPLESISETFGLVTDEPNTESLTDEVSDFVINVLPVEGYSERLYFNKYPLHEQKWGDIDDITWSEVETTYFW